MSAGAASTRRGSLYRGAGSLTGRETVLDAQRMEYKAATLEASGKHMECLQLMEKALQIRCKEFESGEQTPSFLSELCDTTERLVMKCNAFAVKSFKEGKYDVASTLFDYALEITAENSFPLREFDMKRKHLIGVTLNNYGCMERRRGHFAEALSYMQRSMECTGQQSAVAFLNMSAVQTQLRLCEDAAQSAIRAMQNLGPNPEDPSLIAVAHHNLAMALELINPKRALEEYRAALNVAHVTIGKNSDTAATIERNMQRFVQILERQQQPALRMDNVPVAVGALAPHTWCGSSVRAKSKRMGESPAHKGDSRENLTMDIFPHPFINSADNLSPRRNEYGTFSHRPRSSPRKVLPPVKPAPKQPPRGSDTNHTSVQSRKDRLSTSSPASGRSFVQSVPKNGGRLPSLVQPARQAAAATTVQAAATERQAASVRQGSRPSGAADRTYGRHATSPTSNSKSGAARPSSGQALNTGPQGRRADHVNKAPAPKRLARSSTSEESAAHSEAPVRKAFPVSRSITKTNSTSFSRMSTNLSTTSLQRGGEHSPTDPAGSAKKGRAFTRETSGAAGREQRSTVYSTAKNAPSPSARDEAPSSRRANAQSTTGSTASGTRDARGVDKRESHALQRGGEHSPTDPAGSAKKGRAFTRETSGAAGREQRSTVYSTAKNAPSPSARDETPSSRRANAQSTTGSTASGTRDARGVDKRESHALQRGGEHSPTDPAGSAKKGRAFTRETSGAAGREQRSTVYSTAKNAPSPSARDEAPSYRPVTSSRTKGSQEGQLSASARKAPSQLPAGSHAALSSSSALTTDRSARKAQSQGTLLTTYMSDRLDMLLVDEEELRRKGACAVAIQRTYRAFKARQFFKEVTEGAVRDRLLKELKRAIAARKIQKLARRYLSIKFGSCGKFRCRQVLPNERHKAALRIQCCVRRYRARRTVARRRFYMNNSGYAVLRLQMWWRQFLARKKLDELRQAHRDITMVGLSRERYEVAATTIQCFWRSKRVERCMRAERLKAARLRQKYLEARILSATRKIQDVWRLYAARKKVKMLREVQAAREARLMEHQRMVEAARKIQAFGRSIIVKRAADPELERACANAAKRIQLNCLEGQAATKIQRAYRSHHARKLLSFLKNERHRTVAENRKTVFASFIQRVGRGYQARCLLGNILLEMELEAREFARRERALEEACRTPVLATEGKGSCELYEHTVTAEEDNFEVAGSTSSSASRKVVTASPSSVGRLGTESVVEVTPVSKEDIGQQLFPLLTVDQLKGLHSPKLGHVEVLMLQAEDPVNTLLKEESICKEDKCKIAPSDKTVEDPFSEPKESSLSAPVSQEIEVTTRGRVTPTTPAVHTESSVLAQVRVAERDALLIGTGEGMCLSASPSSRSLPTVDMKADVDNATEDEVRVVSHTAQEDQSPVIQLQFNKGTAQCFVCRKQQSPEILRQEPPAAQQFVEAASEFISVSSLDLGDRGEGTAKKALEVALAQEREKWKRVRCEELMVENCRVSLHEKSLAHRLRMIEEAETIEEVQALAPRRPAGRHIGAFARMTLSRASPQISSVSCEQDLCGEMEAEKLKESAVATIARVSRGWRARMHYRVLHSILLEYIERRVEADYNDAPVLHCEMLEKYTELYQPGVEKVRRFRHVSVVQSFLRAKKSIKVVTIRTVLGESYPDHPCGTRHRRSLNAILGGLLAIIRAKKIRSNRYRCVQTQIEKLVGEGLIQERAISVVTSCVLRLLSRRLVQRKMEAVEGYLRRIAAGEKLLPALRCYCARQKVSRRHTMVDNYVRRIAAGEKLLPALRCYCARQKVSRRHTMIDNYVRQSVEADKHYADVSTASPEPDVMYDAGDDVAATKVQCFLRGCLARGEMLRRHTMVDDYVRRIAAGEKLLPALRCYCARQKVLRRRLLVERERMRVCQIENADVKPIMTIQRAYRSYKARQLASQQRDAKERYWVSIQAKDEEFTAAIAAIAAESSPGEAMLWGNFGLFLYDGDENLETYLERRTDELICSVVVMQQYIRAAIACRYVEMLRCRGSKNEAK